MGDVYNVNTFLNYKLTFGDDVEPGSKNHKKGKFHHFHTLSSNLSHDKSLYDTSKLVTKEKPKQVVKNSKLEKPKTDGSQRKERKLRKKTTLSRMSSSSNQYIIYINDSTSKVPPSDFKQ